MYLRLCLPLLVLTPFASWANCDTGAEVCLGQQSAISSTIPSNSESDNSGGTRNESGGTLGDSGGTLDDVNQLVDDITEDLKKRRLTRPVGNNALSKILLLQKYQPDHDYSINGERYVARIYLSMARAELRLGSFDRARARLEAAAEVYPALGGLQKVANDIDAASLEEPVNGSTVASDNRPAAASDDSKLTASGAAQTGRADNTRDTDTDTDTDSGKQATTDAGLLITPVMVGLPAGSFVMGSESGAENEKPAHPVDIEAFSMSRYEITREQYHVYATNVGIESVQPDQSEALLPVAGVTWNEANAYASWLSEKTAKHYRLPTEEEWEYAARAGTVTPYHSGDTIFGLANCLTCVDEIPRSPMTVGSFEPNPFGLYDMHGNVAEWASDCLTSNYFAKLQKSANDCSRRVVRGGSWRLIREHVRSSYRTGISASQRSMDTGFRVVHDGL